MDALGIVFMVLLASGFCWLFWAASRAEAEQERKDREEISRFPPDVQVRLWAAKLRHDAERDLH